MIDTPTEDLRDEAIVKTDATVDEATCPGCGIVTNRCGGGCCTNCECLS